GTGDEGEDRFLDGERFTGAQAELGGRHARAFRRHLDARLEGDLPFIQLLEEEIEGHHLGQRSGVAIFVGIAGIEDLARMGVHDQRGGFGGGCSRGGKGESEDRKAHGQRGAQSTPPEREGSARKTRERRFLHTPLPLLPARPADARDPETYPQITVVKEPQLAKTLGAGNGEKTQVSPAFGHDLEDNGQSITKILTWLTNAKPCRRGKGGPTRMGEAVSEVATGSPQSGRIRLEC